MERRTTRANSRRPTAAFASFRISAPKSTSVDQPLMSTSAKPYKDTLNLPVTKFDLKANLAVREPQIQARWGEHDLYSLVRKSRAGKPRRVLHDGPPYANGETHMGTLLNKV